MKLRCPRCQQKLTVADKYAGRGARTSTSALTNATLPYALKLANKGFQKAVKSDSGLSAGVNTYAGKLTYEAVALSQGREYTGARSNAFLMVVATAVVSGQRAET